MCIPKAFASVLFSAGFELQAQKINTEFSNRASCFHIWDANMTKIWQFGNKILPKWMQVHTKSIGKIFWFDIKPFDILVTIPKRFDGDDADGNKTT